MSGKRKDQSTADFIKALVIREVINGLTKEFRQDIRNGIKYTRKKAGEKAKAMVERYREDGLWGVVRNKQQDATQNGQSRIDVNDDDSTPYPSRFRDSEDRNLTDGTSDSCPEHDDCAGDCQEPPKE